MSDHCHPDYTVQYYDKLDRPLSSPVKISQIEYGRKLDEKSDAEVTYVLPDTNCCQQLGSLESIAHKMAIRENGTMVWYGWLEDIDYKRSQVIVPAFDALGWADRRILHHDLSFTDEDLTDIFEAVWNDAMEPDPISAELILFPSGVHETKELPISELRYASSAIKDMLDTGLDATVIGQKILAGVIPTTKPLEFKLSDFQNDDDTVALTKKGSQFANKIYLNANEAIVGTYPPGPPAPTQLYPLVEHIIYDSDVQDQTSADNAAKSRYEYSRRVPRLVESGDSLVFQPNVNININDLIPGIRVILDTEGLCYETKQEFRLGEVRVTVSGGQRKVAISLQPTGARDSLDSADDPLE